MNPTITAERAERPPPDATVRDYDQLDEREARAVASLADGREEVVVDDASDLTDGEYVKYTGYYRIDVEETRVYTRQWERTSGTTESADRSSDRRSEVRSPSPGPSH